MMENIKKLTINDYEDFKIVFKVWESEPFYEAWSEEEYKEEFIDFINNGVIYGFYEEDKICGLITIKPKYKKWEQIDIDVESSIYLSDIAVIKDKRNKGYGTRLLKMIIDEYGNDYNIYLRTNEQGSMSEGIASKNGFVLMSAPIQRVSFKRTREDIPSIDNRKYMIRRK